MHVVVKRDSIISVPEKLSTSVQHALDMIIRDHEKVFGCQPVQ
ncbi:MAG TPA: hypothetical protein VEY70_16285 [Metabacillus sp.]|nr:hypothetical protein [Metabacillus sp.]